jgi:SH3 domain-containing YSC84-like protein 1
MSTHRGGFTAALLIFAGSIVGCDHGPRSASEAASGNGDRERAVEELADGVTVVREMAGAGSIPLSERRRARCVAVIPSLVSGALLIGARHGHGLVTCRVRSDWSGPAFVTISGGSAGLQAGVQSADLVMLVIGERGKAQLFRSSFELGADASVAAGPAGEAAQAGTDARLTAEVLSYAHTRGLFAGVEVSGAVIKQDRAAAMALYGDGRDVHAILDGELPAPREAAAFLEQVRAAFPQAEEGRPLSSR